MEAQISREHIRDCLEIALRSDEPNEIKAACVFASYISTVLLHIPPEGLPEIKDYIRYLPVGQRLYAVYLSAHNAYLKKEYEVAIGMVESALMMVDEVYPIAMIYLNLMGAMDAMNLRQQELARKYFMDAWMLAKPDELIEGIGEHHGLLQGLIESCMKNEYPEDYQRIIQITYQFSYGWRRIHNPAAKEDVADNLTTTEFTIAMLANRGWTNTEIAAHLNVTIRTVKQHLSSVFDKLNIDNRRQLKLYMLK